MAVYDTEENKRSWMTKATIESLYNTVDFSKHRLVIVDNASCQETQDYYKNVDSFMSSMSAPSFTLIKNEENIGTARAINKAWLLRKPGEHAVKMDNDCVIHNPGWADEMEEVFRRDPKIGICGLKRKDLEESPWNKNPWYTSSLEMLPHNPGESWVVVEVVHHVMGTCQAYNSELLDKIGFLYQMGGLYGFDDSLAAVRASAIGYKNVFLPHIKIDHIDPGDTPYQDWKQKYSGTMIATFNRLKQEYKRGTRSVYYGPDDQ
jgi:GT2 family glycosyltransferase